MIHSAPVSSVHSRGYRWRLKWSNEVSIYLELFSFQTWETTHFSPALVHSVSSQSKLRYVIHVVRSIIHFPSYLHTSHTYLLPEFLTTHLMLQYNMCNRWRSFALMRVGLSCSTIHHAQFYTKHTQLHSPYHTPYSMPLLPFFAVVVYMSVYFRVHARRARVCVLCTHDCLLSFVISIAHLCTFLLLFIYSYTYIHNIVHTFHVYVIRTYIIHIGMYSIFIYDIPYILEHTMYE